MGIKVEKREMEFSKLFPEDMDLYYQVLNRFMNITSENFAGAYLLSKDALAMVDRFSNLSADAAKLALSNTISKTSKTEIKDFCYRKLKVMEAVYETARILWNKGEQRERKSDR
jgi:hypothetical protein